MKIWINAFIPQIVAGYTVALAQGQNAGKTAVPLPLIARLNPVNALKPLTAGYLTDQRGFGPNIDASCRMQSLAILSIGPTGWRFDQTNHRTSGTTEVDMATGATLASGNADMNRCNFFGLDGVVPVQGIPFTQMVYAKAAAADPLVSAAADIDYEAAFTITTTLLPAPLPTVIAIQWQLVIDQFPAFECYVEHQGVVKPVLTSFPDPGKTVADLPGPANRTFTGTILFP